MRIVAGSVRGRTLAAPKSDKVIRPTADRVRETLFNILGQRCDGLHVLDLFAGTGALALEALSRGAESATLVDRHREALSLCKENVKALGFEKQAEVLGLDAWAALDVLQNAGRLFQLIFVDPPYALRAGATALTKLESQKVADDNAVAVVEHAAQEELGARVGSWARIDERRFGDTRISIFRLTLSSS